MIEKLGVNNAFENTQKQKDSGVWNVVIHSLILTTGLLYSFYSIQFAKNFMTTVIKCLGCE